MYKGIVKHNTWSVVCLGCNFSGRVYHCNEEYNEGDIRRISHFSVMVPKEPPHQPVFCWEGAQWCSG